MKSKIKLLFMLLIILGIIVRELQMKDRQDHVIQAISVMVVPQLRFNMLHPKVIMLAQMHLLLHHVLSGHTKLKLDHLNAMTV